MRLAIADCEDADGEKQDSNDDGGLEDNFFSATLGAVADGRTAERRAKAGAALLEEHADDQKKREKHLGVRKIFDK